MNNQQNNNQMPVFDKKGKYLGDSTGIFEGFLMIDNDYEIDLDQIEHVINLSNPCLPTSYYRVIL